MGSRLEWEEVLPLGELGGYWLRWGRVPMKRAAAMLGCRRMLGRRDRDWVWHRVRRCTRLYLIKNIAVIMVSNIAGNIVEKSTILLATLLINQK